jgi:hypothetical protein
VVSDFLIIGDIRDLGQQGYNALTGNKVDGLIVIFSTAGLVGSIASWIPEPGEPVAAGADAGIALLKGLRKINALTERFAGEVLDAIKLGLKTKRLGKLGEVFQDLGTLAKNVPPGTLGTAMKNVESIEDLRAVSRCVSLAPKEATVALSLGGKEAADWMKTTENISKPLIAKYLRKGMKGLAAARPLVRASKFFYRGRVGEIIDRLVVWLIDHPVARNVLLGCGILGFLLSLSFATSAGVHLFHAISSIQQARSRPITEMSAG